MARNRKTPIEIDPAEFRQLGYQLIDTIADFFATIRERPVTTGETPRQLQQALGAAELPEHGTPPGALLARTAELLFDHSLFNGHPKFLGYVTASPAPLGALADLLAAAVNPNVGAQILSPMATEIEKQTVRWLAEFIGFSPDCGGLLVSGGNMANFTGFLAGRTAKGPQGLKEDGISQATDRLTVYCSQATHTWVEKAVVLFGLGARALRWIATDEHHRLDAALLEQTILDDRAQGCRPLMVIGTAGDVSTGAVDDLSALAAICRRYDLWFHIDGAYGIPAAVLPELQPLFAGLEAADSIALDPHKWLYSPLEAGCTLVRNPQHLLETFSAHPVYYNFQIDDEVKAVNFYEYGFQNSRGFRALKVWLALQHVGRRGYVDMIAEDIRLARRLFELAQDHRELEAVTQQLSIATLRYVPPAPEGDGEDREAYLNRLNEALLNALQQGGEVFLSNALVHGRYCLRGCIVNFRTSERDIEEMIDVLVREGRRLHRELSALAFPA
jgi:aromatic-L-amino-acid decarboxylase